MSHAPKSSKPTARSAAEAAEQTMHIRPLSVRRFKSGMAHHVFEARFVGHPPIVVRMGYPVQREDMRKGLALETRLRELGVPLPAVLREGLDQHCPWVAYERLPGTDLGSCMNKLTEGELSEIAAAVAAAQDAASRFGSAGRYGYSTTAEAAPHAKWTSVVEANLERSFGRIAAAGLFDFEAAKAVAALFAFHRKSLDVMPSVPFLHDTTTKNVIVTPQGVFAGIVDVDDLCFGDPRYAAALTLASIQVRGGPESYVRDWMEAAGHKDDAIFRFYVTLFLVDFMSEHGHSFNGNERESTEEDRDELLRVLAEALIQAAR